MKRIFLLEDDAAIARNLLLHPDGFAVTHASTRWEAPVALSESKFDLAFIDISLPNGNGFTVYTKIKKNQYTPIIFLTASGDEESVVTGLNTCTDGYITQSFRSHELIARIGSDMVKKDGSEVFLS